MLCEQKLKKLQMSNQQPTLLVQSNSSDLVCLVRSTDINASLWESVIQFWSDTMTSATEELVTIPVSEFLNNSSWLRSVWTKDGGAVNVDDQARTILAAAKKDFDDFKIHLQSTPSITPMFDDGDLARKLTVFQKTGVARLQQLRAGANFSVPGAGKTTMTLALWNDLVKQSVVSKMLVISPKSAFEAWLNEPILVLNERVNSFVFNSEPLASDIDILIVNFEKLENDESLERITRWLLQAPTMLVIDEAHRIKGGIKSIRWRRCKKLAVHAKRVDLLTGTPMPQDYEDLRNLFAVSWPNVPRTFLTNSLLSSMPRNSIYVRTTKDELNLPPIKIIPTIIKMGKIQTEIYSALRKAYVKMFTLSMNEKSYFGAKGRAIMNLLAASSNPGLLAKIVNEDAYLGLEWPPREISNIDSLVGAVESYVSYEMPPKYKWIRERCEQIRQEGGKVLIWSTLVGNIEALSIILKDLNPAVVYGAVINDERKIQIDKFRNDPSCNVLISNPQTLGEGISLHKECHEAIYLDRSYNAGQYLQSLDRIHRLGLSQDQVTTVHVLISEHSIDERIGARLEEKITSLASALNDEGLLRNSLPDESASLPDEILGIDQFDLADLFSHLRSNE
jgi:SNF2 family DNA or RNA helicase